MHRTFFVGNFIPYRIGLILFLALASRFASMCDEKTQTREYRLLKRLATQGLMEKLYSALKLDIQLRTCDHINSPLIWDTPRTPSIQDEKSMRILYKIHAHIRCK